MNPVTEVFALLQEDPDGKEHLVCVPAIGGSMPMVGPLREPLEAVGLMLHGSPAPVRLVRFASREVLETFTPRPPTPAMLAAAKRTVQ